MQTEQGLYKEHTDEIRYNVKIRQDLLMGKIKKGIGLLLVNILQLNLNKSNSKTRFLT